MLFSAITCTYDQAGYDFKALNGFELDPEDNKNQVADVNENTDLKITTTKFRKGKTELVSSVGFFLGKLIVWVETFLVRLTKTYNGQRNQVEGFE